MLSFLNATSVCKLHLIKVFNDICLTYIFLVLLLDTESSISFNKKNNIPICSGCKVNVGLKKNNETLKPYKVCDFVEENI